jgi:hypothetical protein
MYVHAIRIYRNGTWEDRLSTARHHILHRENDLGAQLYNGLLTSVYFINDVRVGDIVEYQYSVTGGNPLLTSRVDDVAYLENRTSVEQWSYRLLTHPARALEVKPLLTPLSLDVQDITPDLREWSVSSSSTEPRPYEIRQPAATRPFAHIQINEYHTWKAVIETLKPLVALPETFTHDPPSDILLLLHEWLPFDLHERARLAVRFVQNEIRYLSLSDGIAALKPENPAICFTKRFGDCKDKTLLLHGLLQLLGISSTPILVHHSKGESLPSSLPSPLLFDHMILQIELGGETIFVDPTITLQGGPLTSNHCPNYFYGLPLSESSSQLIEMPTEKLSHPITIDTSLTPASQHLLHMHTRTYYYGKEADAMRRKLAYRGAQKLSEGRLLYTQQLYKGALPAQPLECIDDPEQNLFITHEAYNIPLRTRKGYFTVQSQLLHHYLETDINPDRKMPYALAFPCWVQEHIHIEQLSTQDTLQEINFDHDSFLYRSHLKKHNNTADLFFEITFLKSQLQPHEIPSSNAITSRIESDTDLDISFR